MPTSGAQPTMTKRRGKRAKVQVAKRVTLEDAMNAINLSNRSRSPLSELITPEDTPADYVPWERHGIPYLPFAFTNTCCMCGRCGIVPDRKRVMPLGFLKVLLEEEFCRTPFVYNILYQMCTEPSLEMDQATRWQRARLSLLPSAQHQGIPMWLRGRVSICSQCFRSFQVGLDQP